MSFDSDVRWFTNLAVNGQSMAGMPRCSGTAGDLKGMLDVFLNTGTNLKTLTGLSRTNTTATATFSGSPGFVPDQVVQVAGANESEWNDLYRIATIGSNSVTFTVPVGHTASPTGTITMKAAPAGWTCNDDGNNIYRAKSAAQDMTGLTLWVDDSAAKYARVRGWETWVDGVGSGPFPSDFQINGGMYTYKSDASSTAARYYMAFVDRGLIYLFVEWNLTSLQFTFEPLVFGDPVSWMQSDAFCCCVVANAQSGQSVPNSANDFFLYGAGSPTSRYLARNITLNPNTPSTFRCYGPAENGAGLGLGGYTYPSPLDGGDIAYEPIRIAMSSSIPRAHYPGLAVPLHSIPYPSAEVKTFPAKPGRKYMTVRSTSSGSGGRDGNVLIDYIGPWR